MTRKELAVIYGRESKAMAASLMEEMGVARELRPSMRVLIKPNLVTAKESSTGATTTPELVAGVLEFLQRHGVRDIVIAESCWTGGDTREAFRVCGYEELSRRYGVPLIDLKKDARQTVRFEELSLEVCRTVLSADYLINLPVLKGHSQTKLTCALKNLKGCIPDSEKRRYHTLGLHRPIALLNKAVRQHLILVDGLRGDLTFEEGGTPVRMDRLILGKDPVLVDSYAATLIGYRPEEIVYISMACSLGVGCMDLSQARIREFGRPVADASLPSPMDRGQLAQKLARLAAHVVARDACSACYGSLLHALQRLEDRGKLKNLREPVQLGQGFKGVQGKGLGIGSCTHGLRRFLRGCPPRASDILEFLESSHA